MKKIGKNQEKNNIELRRKGVILPSYEILDPIARIINDTSAWGATLRVCQSENHFFMSEDFTHFSDFYYSPKNKSVFKFFHFYCIESEDLKFDVFGNLFDYQDGVTLDKREYIKWTCETINRELEKYERELYA